jgi:hypothetical protein
MQTATQRIIDVSPALLEHGSIGQIIKIKIDAKKIAV